MKRLLLIGIFGLITSFAYPQSTNSSYSEDFVKVIDEIIDLSFKSEKEPLWKAINKLEPFKNNEKTALLAYYHSAFGKWQYTIGGGGITPGDEDAIRTIYEGLDELKKCSELNNDFAEAYALSVNLYYALYFLQPEKRMKLSQEVRALRKKGLELNPKNPLVVLTEAQESFYTPAQFGGSQKKAIELYHESVDLFKEQYKNNQCNMPDWGLELAYSWLANGYFNLEKQDLIKSKKYFEEALKLRPDFAWVKNTMMPRVTQAIKDKG